jgi:hypothetical protein
LDPLEQGANNPSLDELTKLLNGEEGQATPPAKPEGNTGNTTPPAPTADEQKAAEEKRKVEETKAFANRLKEQSEKVRAEEREALAKSMGKQSYEELLKDRELDAAKGKGLDPEAFKEVFEKLYEERVKNDPRMKELDEYRNKKAEEWGQQQMAEIAKLTGGKITKIEQLDDATIKRGTAEGSFVSAYMAIHGAKLLEEVRIAKIAELQKQSTDHLQGPTNQTPPASTRVPTPEERRILEQYAQYSSAMEKDLDKIQYKK